MSEPAPRPRAHWSLGLGVFSARPKLVAALVAGAAVGLGCLALAPQLRPVTCAVAGWDAFCLLYLGLVAQAVQGHGPDDIRARASREDQGGGVILLLIVLACSASLAAVGVELSLARHEDGLDRTAHVAVAFATVAASWLVMQVIYALHYAHEYYACDPATGRDVGGLAFLGDEPPDYWDFLHFSIVLGVAGQTADVAFTDRRLRRTGTAHSLIAFVFNTLIVALTINLVAGLF